MEKADTGDILLFKASNPMAGAVRMITSSGFDHVAMVLRFESDLDEIYFIEASGNNGVALNNWSFIRQHVGPNKFYKHICFRHVDFDRDGEMVNNLEKFLKQAIGKKYGLGVKKMLRRETQCVKQKASNDGSSADNDIISDDRTFFCSELVAKACKVLGILENDKTSTTKFLPKHFSSKSDKFLQLTPDTYMDQELKIILDENKDKASNALLDAY